LEVRAAEVQSIFAGATTGLTQLAGQAELALADALDELDDDVVEEINVVETLELVEEVNVVETLELVGFAEGGDELELEVIGATDEVHGTDDEADTLALQTGAGKAPESVALK
jgi:hypothetical protein